MDCIKKVFATIGSLAPILLLLLTCLLLRNKKTYLLIFLSGFVINNIFNILLKITIQEPRPEDDTRLFHLKLTNGKRMHYDKFGMPSGHAQNCFYCLAFVLYVLQNSLVNWVISVYFLLSIVSIFQRYLYNNHTLIQLIVGALIGTLVCYATCFTGNIVLQGRMSLKADDYCLV